ncbi:MAG: TRAP transporter small permease [Bradymonadia bacterium]
MASTPPEAEQGDAAPLPGLMGTLDGALFAFEKAFVTVAGLVMTFTVTLGIIYRSFATDRSRLGEIIAGVMTEGDGPPDPELLASLNANVVPIILALTAFGAGWGVYGARRRRMATPGPKLWGPIWGALALVGAYGMIQFVVKVPSKWVTFSVLEVGMLGYLAYSVKAKQTAGIALAVIFGALGGWASMLLPEGYTWAEELALILLAWMAFLGASMATRVQRHIVVDALSRVMPAKMGAYARALGLLVTALICLYVSILAYEAIFGPRGDLASGEVRPATGLPAWTITASVTIAFAFMGLRFLAYAIHAFMNPTLPERQVTH